MIEQAGLRIVAQKRVRITREQAETFYGVHRERPFFGELVEFMTSGPVVVQVLEGENAIAKYRDVMGATDPAKARRAPSARSTPGRSARTRCTARTRRTPPPRRSRSSSPATRSSARQLPEVALAARPGDTSLSFELPAACAVAIGLRRGFGSGRHKGVRGGLSCGRT